MVLKKDFGDQDEIAMATYPAWGSANRGRYRKTVCRGDWKYLGENMSR